MARTHRSGVKPPLQYRCMVEGCDIYGVWQTCRPDEEFMADTADPRSHYWQVHYVATEAAYMARVAEQREARMAHYRETGQFLPPTL